MRFAKLAHFSGLVNGSGVGSWELGERTLASFLLLAIFTPACSNYRSALPTPNYFNSETIF
jgi:hypothetical protein